MPFTEGVEKKFERQLPDVHSMGVLMVDPICALETRTSGRAELIHVTGGSLELVTDVGQFSAGPGDTLLLPSKTPHRDEFDLDVGLQGFFVSFSWKAEKEYFALEIARCSSCSATNSGYTPYVRRQRGGPMPQIPNASRLNHRRGSP